jgi:hypothetical protein
MKRTIRYEAISEDYNTHEITFIGEDEASLDRQEYEHEEWLNREHSGNLWNIYKSILIGQPYDKSSNE